MNYYEKYIKYKTKYLELKKKKKNHISYNLPNSIEYIELPKKYDLQIFNISKNLKSIKYVQGYKYNDFFNNINIEYY
jgi:hypothetical protein